MIEQEILEICQEEIRNRLKKYDVVGIPKNEDEMKKSFMEAENKYFSEKNTSNDRQGVNTAEDENKEKNKAVLNILESCFFDEQSFTSIYSRSYLGIYETFNSVDKSIPPAIRDVYMHTLTNLSAIREGDWQLYEKDVLRAVAYHDYVSHFQLKKEEVLEKVSYVETEYMNMPISVEIQEKGNTYYAFPNMGRVINLMQIVDKKNNFKNIFKKNIIEFNEFGEMECKRVKGVNYKLLKKEIENIAKESMSASDMWLLKNIYDPELITAICQVVEKKNILKHDYKLIWILCSCQCPSVRLYLFEAVKSSYSYIKKHCKTNDGCIEFLQDQLTYIIQDINFKFQEMVNWAAACFEEYSTNSEEVIKYNKLEHVPNKEDDFLFIFGKAANKVNYCDYFMRANCHPANYVMPLLSDYSEVFLPPDSMTGILRHPCSA